PGIRCQEPRGAFYIFPDISSYGKDDRDVARELLQAGVSLIPGSPFGLGGEGHLRISYSTRVEDIVEGMQRIKMYFEALQ
ncbi:MAG: pyridoxal phosphate-dependent aminotransferase, partial [Candidatus Bathyarchaeia archaeon]